MILYIEGRNNMLLEIMDENEKWYENQSIRFLREMKSHANLKEVSLLRKKYLIIILIYYISWFIHSIIVS